MKHWLVILCISVAQIGYTQTLPTVTSLKDHQVSLESAVRGKVAVFLMLSPECPLCQSYSLTIRKLHETFAQKGVVMIGIVPDKDYSNLEIAEFVKKYKLPIQVYKDPQMRMVKYLNATITPEAFVMNKQKQVVYSGRIDNWAYELGKKRKVITEHNLRDALEQVLHQQPVKISHTKAIGCFIE